MQLFFTLITETAFARVSLLPSPTPAEVAKPLAVAPATKWAAKPNSLAKPSIGVSNLPPEYQRRVSKADSEDGGQVLTPTVKEGLIYRGLLPGEVLQAEIKEGALAFHGSKAPVRALIRRGNLKGGIFLGEASLEENSKRINITFTNFRPVRSETTYEVKAHALDDEGVLGIEGELHSGEAGYFVAEMLAGGAAGFVDAGVQRSENVLGNPVDAPTVSNAGKKALTGALGKTAERYSEKMKTVPEYSVFKGPTDIQILITDEAKQK